MFKEIVVPFDANGNMCHSAWNGHESRRIDRPMNEDLQFDHMLLNSSAIAVFKSNRNDVRYFMNNTEFQRIVPFMVNGRLVGDFTFSVHAGKYYSIKFLND